ncbi:MAG: hypothetical protein NTZ20_02170 [Candidatus Levybacteria bacterium]|nr:hypothetical protein [Candidatus Levybacteria bacterium]
MLRYITSNKEKIITARRNLEPLGITFQEFDLELAELQSESFVEIATYKAKQAYEKLHIPLFISDHGWSIPALNGFPGAYMKYMNKWLSSQDFLNLMQSHDDKTIIKSEVICYIDGTHIKHFIAEIKGSFINEIRGEGLPAMRVASLLPSGKTVAECTQEGINSYVENTNWKEFATWLKENTSL